MGHYSHQHVSHQETGTFAKAFGLEAGAGCGRIFVLLIGCGSFLFLLMCTCAGLLWYVSQPRKEQPRPTPTVTHTPPGPGEIDKNDVQPRDNKQAPPNPEPKTVITIRAFLGQDQTGESVKLHINGQTIEWQLTSTMRKKEIAIELPGPGKYEYELESTTTGIIKYKEMMFSGKGSGSIDVVANRRFVYLLDFTKGANPFLCYLKPDGP